MRRTRHLLTAAQRREIVRALRAAPEANNAQVSRSLPFPVSPRCVGYYRAQLGIPSAPRGSGHTHRVDGAAVDWLRSTSDLATEHGVSQAWISKLRRQHAPKTMGRINRRRLALAAARKPR